MEAKYGKNWDTGRFYKVMWSAYLNGTITQDEWLEYVAAFAVVSARKVD